MRDVLNRLGLRGYITGSEALGRYGEPRMLTLEDLVIAKLAWSEGTSELQLRDCRNLVRVKEARIDWVYLERWAAHEGISGLLVQVRHAP